MAKKYLLYIHNDVAFDKEMYKSELVNRLLENHWNRQIPGDYIAPIEDIEQLKDSVSTKLSGKTLAEIIPDLLKPCKHGADLKLCRFAKNGKPCK